MHPALALPVLLGLMFALFPFIIFGLFLMIAVGGTVLWVMAIVSCAKNESPVGNDKIVWLLIILFLHVIGAAIYFLVRRPQRIRELGR